MPLSLPAITAAILCDDKELEAYDVKQEGTSLLTAFVASEAGKEFKITFSNTLTDSEIDVLVCIDGRLVRTTCLRSGRSSKILGLRKGELSLLPFKFQELQLVDSDSQDAPVAPEMGTIELKAYRCQSQRVTGSESTKQMAYEDAHCGRISEHSKQVGWHHVGTGDERPSKKRRPAVKVKYLDPRKGPPYASIKIFYRPRELLRAQGIIPVNDVGRQRSAIEDKNRAGEDGSPGPSRSRPKIELRSEEHSGDTVARRLEAVQVALDALKADLQSGSYVERESGLPSL